MPAVPSGRLTEIGRHLTSIKYFSNDYFFKKDLTFNDFRMDDIFVTPLTSICFPIFSSAGTGAMGDDGVRSTLIDR